MREFRRLQIPVQIRRMLQPQKKWRAGFPACTKKPLELRTFHGTGRLGGGFDFGLGKPIQEDFKNGE